jgi:hypothetical protein
VLLQPDLLILDEPTNHINFRHLPIIADALNEFRGGALSAICCLPFIRCASLPALRSLLSTISDNLLSTVWFLLIATLYAYLLSSPHPLPILTHRFYFRGDRNIHWQFW